ncbi:MAG TPA: lytic transglycosylase domain-containing protein [Rhizomicrobium sp.]|jgi:soluble lytic murein transglycosylase-like protein|nr:lytic transglycosylase domain-containing protein [Rhizomicrobium sp.]
MPFRDAILPVWTRFFGRPNLPPAVVAAALMSAAVFGGLLLNARAVHPPHRAAPKPAVHRAAPTKRVASRKPAVVRPAAKAKPMPSVFALEEAMSYRERMDRWNPLIREASRRFAVSGLWIRAVMMLESGGRTMLSEKQRITSSAGAMGLMQLMPNTYAQMRRAYGLGADPYDPHDNVVAGAAVLHELYLTYGYPTMFAAYNDGPGMLEAHRRLNQLLPVETTDYVRNIASILSTGAPHRHGSARDLARLTRPDGTAVLIDAGAVLSIRAALPGEYAPSVRAVIGIGRLRQGVRETVAAATAVIRGHGGLI